MPKLDPKNVLPALVALIPIGEKWGMGDDFEREEAVGAAPADELVALVHCIDGIADEEFYGWLSGPESFSANPSKEYIAMSNLALAIDSAKSRARKLGL